MTEEDIIQEFRLEKIKKKYFIKVIDQNELLSYENKNVCTALNELSTF